MANEEAKAEFRIMTVAGVTETLQCDPETAAAISDALALAEESAVIDGAHHKQWVIDQMVRALLGMYYTPWREIYALEYPEPWDEGICAMTSHPENELPPGSYQAARGAVPGLTAADAVAARGEDYPQPPTGLILTGDVAALQRTVEAQRRHIARCEVDNTRLRRALQAARLPHAAACPAYTDPTLPCGCLATQHNAAIDAALGAES